MSLSRRQLLRNGALTALVIPCLEALNQIGANAATSLLEPKRIKSSNGQLNVNLEAKESLLDFEGKKRWALTYNGTFPGPTLVAKPGDVINVNLKNSTKQPTNLHTHGPHLSPSGNSDNPFIMVAPGESFKYTFRIPKNQEPGTFWYHPHHHEFVAKQLSAGLAGAIIVEGESDQLLTDTTDRTLLLADPRIGSDSSVMDTSMMDQMHGRVGDYLLINGQLAPTITAKVGKTERWRLINASPSLFLNLSIDGANFLVIGTDGGRTKPFSMDKLVITPGQRYEVLINAKKSGNLGIYNGSKLIGYLNTSANTPISPSIASIPILQNPVKTRTLKIAQGGGGMMGGMRFTFNGESFDPNRVNQSVKLNTVEDWIISNTSHMAHPFHIHAWAFQVIDRGDGKSEPGWKDTVAIPVGAKVRIRLNFADFGGKTVYHCHILDHEDTGMMGIVEVK